MFKGLPKGQQLQHLKRQGTVSISRVATRAVGLGAICVSFLVLAPRVKEDFRLVVTGTSQASFEGSIRSLAFVVMATSLSVVLLGVLSTVLQSRGGFGWSILQKTRREPAGFHFAGACVVTVGVIAVVAAALVGLNLVDFFEVLRATNVVEALSKYEKSLGFAAKLVVVGAVVCAILAATLTRFFFLLKNRVRSEH